MSEEKKSKEQGAPAEAGPAFPSGFAARRNLLKIGFGAICCAGAAEAGWPMFRFLTAPEGGEAEPVAVPKAQVPPGAMVKVLYGRTPVLIINESGKVYVLSRVCTHLGCLVDWSEDQRQFHCPCHDGYFDKQGAVKGGPPPRALDRVPFTTTESAYVIGLVPDEGAEDKKA